MGVVLSVKAGIYRRSVCIIQKLSIRFKWMGARQFGISFRLNIHQTRRCA